MTKFSAAMAHVADSCYVYVIDPQGGISTVTLVQYETMDMSDPRIKRVAWTRRRAELTSLRVRGIENGFEMPKRLEN